MFKTLQDGVFAGIRRPIDGGKGLAGVFEKDSTYFNPFIEPMLGGKR
jgi:beta-lysine 5,6-aminomutase alpha subunit